MLLKLDLEASKEKNTDAGFTFVETLVSLTIFALILGSSYQLVITTSKSLVVSKQVLKARQLAEEEIAYLKSRGKNNVLNKSISRDGFDVEVLISPREIDGSKFGTITVLSVDGGYERSWSISIN